MTIPVLVDFSTVDPLPKAADDISTALANARPTGLGHLRWPKRAWRPFSTFHGQGSLRYGVLHDARLALDIAVLANLALDAHPPGPDRFESYELVDHPDGQ